MESENNMISKNTKDIIFTKDLLYGLFTCEDGDNYMFDYGVEKDNGLGVIVNQRTMEVFTVTDEKHDASTGNIKSVTVQL